MKDGMKHIAAMCLGLGLAAVLVTAPRPAAAQCGMMGGGGSHDRSAATAADAKTASKSQKQMQQKIDQVLADEQGRDMLVSVLLTDRAFLEGFIRRLAAVPEWRAMIGRQLRAGSAEDDSGVAKLKAPSASLYVCPMHPEVTSAVPADCPRCGMTLERRSADGK